MLCPRNVVLVCAQLKGNALSRFRGQEEDVGLKKYLLHLCRTLMVPISDIVKPGFKTVVVGEGMPKPTGGKGDLIVEVELLFPTGLNETQKMLMR